jgi:hypothetical protein
VYPLQRASLTPAKIAEVKVAIDAIVNQATSLFQSHPLDSQRFMLFPLFLAGIESTSPKEKMWIADTLAAFARSSVGRNTKVVNEVFREVYAQQMMAEGEGSKVDWMEFMGERGWRVVVFDI